jgi:pimeloyl-ACP methyl ester carboxylesterase
MSQDIAWQWDGTGFSLGIDRMGEGRRLLLLPALSSISTRREMAPLQERLASSFETVAVDWPGFGDRPKPALDWRPAVYEAFLDELLTKIVPHPLATIAAGHAAGYLIKYAARHPHAAGRLVLLSPTWRGPLPTMMGGDRPLFRKIARTIDKPVVGPLLYRLNVNRLVIGMMARGHVYADPAWLDAERMRAKHALTRTAGARHASARFVTGQLDPFRSHDEQAAAVRAIADPILNLFAANTPRKSKAEMEALAALPGVTTIRLPKGKLSVYEEFPDQVALQIEKFLAA